jgi:D-alanine-D-alanine ligase
VLVLFGGRSGEHSISCATAAGVLAAIDRDRYDVVAIGITRAGDWTPVSDDPQQWEIRPGYVPEIPESSTHALLPQAWCRDLQVVEPGAAPRPTGPVDVVFPLLHGPYGEDGTLQGMLEMADVRYVGAGVLASAVGMDKQMMKVVLAGQGLPVGPYRTVRPGRLEHDLPAVLDEIAELGLPVFVKPARAGSSLGISKVDDAADLPAALAEASQHDPKLVVEAAIRGREIECGVLGGRGGAAPRAALPAEVVVADPDYAFYDYQAKYFGAGDVRLECPADLPAAVVTRVQDIAVRTFEALGCEGLARVDVFVTDDGQVVVNEINTMPGFTPFSMYPMMWQASGMSYTELVDELICLALERPTGLR